jgi:sarcosine oxidase, subunit gamma
MDEPAWSVSAGRIVVTRMPPAGMHILRLRGFGEDTLRTLGEALGTAIPREPNHAVGAEPRVMWLGPGEWLIVGEVDAEVLCAAAVEATVMHVASVGDSRASYALTGHVARDLLAKGCSLDLHPRTFAVGRCAQTLFAQVSAVIDHPSDDVFVLQADASYAHHLQSWFSDAVIEFRWEDIA